MRFSIRDLLWLTVVVALAVGWWLDHRRLGQMMEENEKVTKYLEFYERELISTRTNGFAIPPGRVIPESVIIKEHGTQK